MKVMNWLADMIGLPEEFKFNASTNGKGGGVIQGTASEATLVALLGAKARIANLEKKLNSESLSSGDTNNNNITDANNNLSDASINNITKLDINNNRGTNGTMSSLNNGEIKEEILTTTVASLTDQLVGYCSELAHSSVERAGLLAGVKIISIPTDDNCRLRGEQLRKQIELDKINGLVPFFAVCTLGTTSVCTFDDLDEMGQVCQEYGLWLHVDAAYAGSAFVCPEFRHLMAGVEVSFREIFNARLSFSLLHMKIVSPNSKLPLI